MHSSGSFIETVLEKIRLFVVDPGAGTGMFNDDVIVRQLMGTAWAETLSLLKLTDDSLPIIKTTITIEQGTSRYKIPPYLEMVLRLCRVTDDKRVWLDWVPGELFGVWGPGWRLEQNEIVFEPTPSQPPSVAGVQEDWELWGVPSGDVCLHKGTGTVVSPTVITLAATPTLGLLDRRPNAYAGQVLRLLSAGRSWQEGVIASYDHTTRRVTMHTAFVQGANDLPADAASVDYEIAPVGNRAVWDTVGWKVCMMIGASRNIQQKQMVYFDLMYQKGIKAMMDRAQHNWRLIKHFSRKTVDNQPLFSLSSYAFDGEP